MSWAHVIFPIIKPTCLFVVLHWLSFSAFTWKIFKQKNDAIQKAVLASCNAEVTPFKTGVNHEQLKENDGKFTGVCRLQSCHTLKKCIDFLNKNKLLGGFI